VQATAPRLILLVAVADNGVIGCNGQLPWHLPADLKRFKALTMGKPIVMGRRTHESIGRALPGRRNLVVSRDAARHARDALTSGDGVEWVESLAVALAACSGAPEVCVIGGAGLYATALPYADIVELTRVHAAPAGDVYFPALPETQWQEVARSEHAADEQHAHAMSFITLRRTTPSKSRSVV
jgi:dihydrofolate reductase